MRNIVTRLLACLSLLFFLVPVTFVHGPKPVKNDIQYIVLEPVKFHSENPEVNRAGRLEFLAGWRMTSENSDFGGISSMLMAPNNRILMLSDAGVLIGFTLNEADNLAERPFIAPLPDGPVPKNEYAMKNWDAEALVYNPATGQYWVGYERGHGVWRYGPSFARKEAAHGHRIMQKWPINGGAEAMLRLSDSRFLVFSEAADFKNGGTQALIFSGDPAEPETKAELFGYRPPKGFQITDAAMLPDGQALLLHRRFTPLDGVSAILSVADPAEISAGKVWESRQIAALRPPMRVDNMEALAVTQEGSDTIIWLASDDNFNSVQENLLMKFRLLKGKEKREKADSRPDGKDAETEKAEDSPGFSALQN